MNFWARFTSSLKNIVHIERIHPSQPTSKVEMPEEGPKTPASGGGYYKFNDKDATLGGTLVPARVQYIPPVRPAGSGRIKPPQPRYPKGLNEAQKDALDFLGAWHKYVEENEAAAHASADEYCDSTLIAYDDYLAGWWGAELERFEKEWDAKQLKEEE